MHPLFIFLPFYPPPPPPPQISVFPLITRVLPTPSITVAKTRPRSAVNPPTLRLYSTLTLSGKASRNDHPVPNGGVDRKRALRDPHRTRAASGGTRDRQGTMWRAGAASDVPSLTSTQRNGSVVFKFISPRQLLVLGPYSYLI